MYIYWRRRNTKADSTRERLVLLARYLLSEGGTSIMHCTVSKVVFTSLILGVVGLFQYSFLGLELCTESTKRMVGFSWEVRQEQFLPLSNSTSCLRPLFLATYHNPSSVPC